MIDPVEFGKQMGAIVREATAPLLKRIEELEARQPEKGDKGDSVTIDDLAPLIADAVKAAVDQMPKPEDGKDAEPVLVADIVKELLGTDELRTLVNLEVVAYLKENPPEKGDKGDKGTSVTMEDVSLILDAAISKHVLDLERRATDTLQRAIDRMPVPEDGKDGADFTDASIEFDGERTITIRGKGAEIVKRLPIPLDRGYWMDGMACEKGDMVTHDGTLWMALRDTLAAPAVQNKDDWRIAARKGRDGKDGKVIRVPETVKLSDG